MSIQAGVTEKIALPTTEISLRIKVLLAFSRMAIQTKFHSWSILHQTENRHFVFYGGTTIFCGVNHQFSRGEEGGRFHLQPITSFQ